MNMIERALNKISNIVFSVFKQHANKDVKVSSLDVQLSAINKELLEQSIVRWKGSTERMMQIKGQLYYEGEHDILKRKRTIIGEGGKITEVDNLPNNRVVDNQYGKIVNQKANYLLGKPFVVESDDKKYVEFLNGIFKKRFMKTLKNAGKSALNCGISWLYPYYDGEGEFKFRLFPGYEILPFWADSEHTVLEGAARLYLVNGFSGNAPIVIEKVEIYDRQGIHRYILDGSALIPDITNPKDENGSFHVTSVDDKGNVQGFNWSRIPLIPIKYNEQEIPLIQKVKSLQDGINIMISDFENNMQEDSRNTILVLKNYNGTDLGEFRRNLATYGAIKVRYDGEVKGGVETLEVEVNADNYKSIIEIFKKALIENAMGYDAKDDRLSGNPNQMNIQSMYSDIDLDANDMETELQSSFEDILWFINAHLANTGHGDFEHSDVTIIFNRDILINESEAIANCQASVGIISDETIVEQHPWINDLEKELSRLEDQRKRNEDNFGFESDEGNGDA